MGSWNFNIAYNIWRLIDGKWISTHIALVHVKSHEYSIITIIQDYSLMSGRVFLRILLVLNHSFSIFNLVH